MTKTIIARSVFLLVVALASIAWGIAAGGVHDLVKILIISAGAILLYWSVGTFVRTKKDLEERRRREVEQKRTLAPVSPEWEKIRSESDRNRGKLVKQILKKRGQNPHEGLLRDFLKKK